MARPADRSAPPRPRRAGPGLLAAGIRSAAGLPGWPAPRRRRRPGCPAPCSHRTPRRSRGRGGGRRSGRPGSISPAAPAHAATPQPGHQPAAPAAPAAARCGGPRTSPLSPPAPGAACGPGNGSSRAWRSPATVSGCRSPPGRRPLGRATPGPDASPRVPPGRLRAAAPGGPIPRRHPHVSLVGQAFVKSFREQGRGPVTHRTVPADHGGHPRRHERGGQRMRHQAVARARPGVALTPVA